jgi:hypothetical protein
LSPHILSFLASRGWTSLSDWADDANVPRQSVYSFRHGRTLAAGHVAKLAKAAHTTTSEVLALLTPGREARP